MRNPIKRYRCAGQNYKAVQFLDDPDTLETISNWFAENGITETIISYSTEPPVLKVQTREDKDLYTIAQPGDYVALNPFGGFYAYQQEHFNQSFFEVRE